MELLKISQLIVWREAFVSKFFPFIMSRITLTTVITGHTTGLKTVIKEFLAANDVGCILQTTMIEVGDSISRLTMLTMEGEMEKLIETRDLLVLELNGKFAGIKYEAWDQNESEKPWPTTQIIKPTPGSLTRNSSGFVDEEIAQTDDTFINERIIKAAKALGGHAIKAVTHGTPLLVKVAQTAGEIKQIYSRASSLTDGLVKNAAFSYQNSTVLLNTQPCLDWTLLMHQVKKVFAIAEQTAVNIYKKLDDGTLCKILDISGIDHQNRYYVQTDADALKGTFISNLVHFSTIEQFFDKLKTEQEVDDDDIQTIKGCFVKQKIKFRQLMATGELAMTDAELKDYGINQGGLRKAILSVIKSNIQ
jgi:hypothetical protein